MGVHKHRSRNKGRLTFAAKATITAIAVVACLFAVWLFTWGYSIVKAKTERTVIQVTDKTQVVAAKYKGLAELASNKTVQSIQSVRSAVQKIHPADATTAVAARAHPATTHAADSLPPAPIPPAEHADPPPMSKDFVADFEVQLSPGKKGVISIVFRHDWAPLGVGRVRELVEDKFFDQVRFFRVLKGFMAQFGISGDPAKQRKWSKSIRDDPVVESNRRGFVTFAMAGKHTRSTQLFINFGDNIFLDKQGFSPVGKVIAGMDVVDGIYAGHKEKPSQHLITSQGNSYLEKEFKELSYIVSATLKPAPPL